jgi:DNA mismatch repair protein MSH5
MDVSKLKKMGTAINETIDWETSENERRTSVRQHIDEELDDLKRVYYGLDNLLSKAALQVKKSVPSS